MAFNNGNGVFPPLVFSPAATTSTVSYAPVPPPVNRQVYLSSVTTQIQINGIFRINTPQLANQAP